MKRAHTQAILDALKEISFGDGQLNVGDAEAPKEAAPYAVLYPLPGGSRSGSLEDPHEDAELDYQVTCVGVTRRQAEWIADAVDDRILAGVLVPGRSISVDVLSNAGVSRDDSADPPLFVAFPRYRFMTTPGAEEES